MNADDLRADNERLQTENAELKQRLADLDAVVRDLKAQLEAALRASKRQATPFSKDAPKAKPKKPGRKAGHPAAHRAVPDHVDRVAEASLPATCPDCAGPVLEDAVHVQYQEDIPRPVPTIVTQFNVHIGHCAQCQRRIQGRHPDQTSDALGAAAIQIGPNALGLAAEMKHGLGVSYGKVARLLETSLGLRLGRSTVARADEVVDRILGEDFAGVLGCDCFLAYDALPTYTQSKCAGHLLRRGAEIGENKSGRAVRFSQQVARLLRAAITVKQRHLEAKLSTHGYAVACGRLEAALDRLLAGHYTDPDNARFAKLLRKQRPHLLTFLYVDAMAPTNNAAEREIRPAVLIRKTNGCNRSETGALTHSILTSIIRTCQKHGQDFVNAVKRVLRQPAPLVLDLVSETTR